MASQLRGSLPETAIGAAARQRLRHASPDVALLAIQNKEKEDLARSAEQSHGRKKSSSCVSLL